MNPPRDQELPAEDELLVRHQDGVLWLTLNRPHAANALTPDQRDRLAEQLEQASSDHTVRAVVLSATGRHFCAGMDMRAPRPGAASDVRVPGSGIFTQAAESQRLIKAIVDCYKPVVAAVQGPAAGLGLYLALASDLVIAGEEAAFVETFVSRAMAIHCGGAHLLTTRLGVQRAKQFFLLGERLGAAEALELGLVQSVVPAERLDDATQDVVRRLADGPTAAIGLSKRLFNRALQTDLATIFEEEAMVMELVGQSEDMREGRAAFVERRAPKFVGR